VEGQIAVAIIKNDQVFYYGIKKRGKNLMEVENKKGVFALGTFTSIFTNTLLAQAAVDKKLKLWEDINAYYPKPFKDTLSFSFTSLANGSALLPFFPKITIVPEDMGTQKKSKKDQAMAIGNASIANYLAEDLVLDTITTRGRFSIFGISVLGDALARVYEKPYASLFQTQIVDKYNLTSTYLIKPKRLSVIESIGKVDLGLDKKANYFDIFLPSTQGYSTVEDLAHYVQLYFTPNHPELALMQKPTGMITQDDWISLGWRLNLRYNTNVLHQFSYFTEVNHAVFSLSEEKGKKLSFLLWQMMEEFQSKKKASQKVLRSYLNILLIEFDRLYVPQHTVKVHNAVNDKIQRYQTLIEQHFKTHKMPSDYAEMLNISTNYLNKICRTILGHTSGNLIKRHIILEAKRLLSYTTNSIGEIADELGFEHASYFVTMFKKATTQTPEQFRKSQWTA